MSGRAGNTQEPHRIDLRIRVWGRHGERGVPDAKGVRTEHLLCELCALCGNRILSSLAAGAFP